MFIWIIRTSNISFYYFSSWATLCWWSCYFTSESQFLLVGEFTKYTSSTFSSAQSPMIKSPSITFLSISNALFPFPLKGQTKICSQFLRLITACIIFTYHRCFQHVIFFMQNTSCTESCWCYHNNISLH